MLQILIPLAKAANNHSPRQLQSIDAIYNTAKIFLEQHVAADPAETEITIGKIDPRIKFTQCDGNLQAFFPQGSKITGKITLGVACQGKVKWKLFIPAKINRYETVWLAKRSLSSSDVITNQDIYQQKVIMKNLRKSPMKKLDLLVGTSPKRRIPSGSVIYQDATCMVCDGDKVMVTAKNALIDISVEGIALHDAKRGEVVKIKNLQSNRIFTAIVKGKGQLVVKLAKNINQ